MAYKTKRRHSRRHSRRHNRSRRMRGGQRGGFWDALTSWWGKAKQGTSSMVSGAENILSNASNTVSSSAQSALDKAKGFMSTDIPLTSSSSSSSSSYSVPAAAPSTAPSTTAAPSTAPSSFQPSASDYQTQAYGGRKRKHKRSRKQRGGSKYGLTFYASPVSNTNTAKPTYWI